MLIFYVKIISNKFIKKEFLYEIRKNVITLHLFRGRLFISCAPETPKNEQLSYPQNLSEADKSKIKNLSYESYSEILESFKTLNSLEPVKNEYNNFLQNVINQLESNNFEVEELEFDNIEEMTNFLLEEKNLENATNLGEYLDLQNIFESVKTEYENFYNGDYLFSYQDLQTKYYEANANITKNQYNELINFLKSVFEDIQEDFILNKQTNLIETTNIRFTEAQTENTSNTKQINDYKNSTEKSTYDAKKIDLETLKQLVVEAKKSADDFTLIYDTENPDEPEVNPEEPEVNPEEPEVNPEEPEVNPEEPEVNPEEPEVNPEEPEVNPDDPEENPDEPEINPDEPEIDTTDYTKLEMFENVDDVWTMKELPEDLTKYAEQTSVSYNIPAGQEVAIDIDMLLSNKEKLEKANVPVSLNIPSDSTIYFYTPELGGSPDMIGLEITQLQPVIDFVFGDKINEYKNASDKTKVELPNTNLYVVNMGIGDGNLYGTGVDKIIEMYYNTNNASKLNYENYTGGTVFDAVDALPNGKMYDEENNFIDAYALDINAALLMNIDDIKNVKVVGENKTGKSQYNNGFHNIRFETDLDGFVFNGSGSGIIDYVGSAPALTINGCDAKTIIRKPSKDMIVKGGHTVDLSKVENSSLLDNIAEFREASEIYYKTQEDATRGFSGGYIDAIYIGDKLYSKDETYTPVNATNQQWIDASNNNLWSEGQNSLHYPKDVHNEAEEWVFE